MMTTEASNMATILALKTELSEARDKISALEADAKREAEKKRYNGHANYETWVVSMYVDGNYDGEGTYKHWHEVALEACSENTDSDGVLDRDGAIYALSQTLRDEMRDGEMREEAPVTGVYADLLGASLDEVSWYDIAESLVDTAIESDYAKCNYCDNVVSNDETCPCQHDVHHYVSIRAKVEDGAIVDHEVLRHGRMASDYFQGCGTSLSRYTHVATGVGADDDEALEDAIEQMACQDVDTSSLPY